MEVWIPSRQGLPIPACFGVLDQGAVLFKPSRQPTSERWQIIQNVTWGYMSRLHSFPTYSLHTAKNYVNSDQDSRLPFMQIWVIMRMINSTWLFLKCKGSKLTTGSGDNMNFLRSQKINLYILGRRSFFWLEGMVRSKSSVLPDSS